MTTFPADSRLNGRRIASAGGVALVHLVIAYVLISSMAVVTPRHAGREDAALIVVHPIPLPLNEPPPPPKKPSAATKRPATPAPPAPAPSVVLPSSPPAPAPVIIAAPTIGGGDILETSGAGAGGGAGGQGSGGGGDGNGAGEGFIEARQTGGRFRNSDFPASTRGAGRLRVGVRYAIGPDGRVGQCEITEPSGYPDLDMMTCRVIIERYRFRPARDGNGVAITEVTEDGYTWTMK